MPALTGSLGPPSSVLPPRVDGGHVQSLTSVDPVPCYRWGYSGTDYASNIGIQPVSIMSMVKALIGSE